MAAHLLTGAMTRAVAKGLLNPEVVLSDARRAAALHVAPVFPIGELDRGNRVAPSLEGHDDPLSSRTLP